VKGCIELCFVFQKREFAQLKGYSTQKKKKRKRKFGHHLLNQVVAKPV